ALQRAASPARGSQTRERLTPRSSHQLLLLLLPPPPPRAALCKPGPLPAACQGSRRSERQPCLRHPPHLQPRDPWAAGAATPTPAGLSSCILPRRQPGAANPPRTRWAASSSRGPKKRTKSFECKNVASSCATPSLKRAVTSQSCCC
ncbi:hypothetical protein KIL84_022838, partial [Mauremys mutica]